MDPSSCPAPCSSTERMIADGDTSATDGEIRWSPAKSLWTAGMTASAILLAPVFISWGAVAVFLVLTAMTLCLGHSLGMHRLLIHKSFRTAKWFERSLVYLGTLVGMAGPTGMVRLHDTRDWAQRQSACHDYHAHRTTPLCDMWWQMHCRLDLRRPPTFVPERSIAEDVHFAWMERSWMVQQVPLGLLLYGLGGLPWLVWGIPVRIAVSLTGHWAVGHVTHRTGPQGWLVDGAAVQGHDLPGAALVTFGEAWHGNHHAWPGSARFGLEPGQHDPGWWVLVGMRRLGLVWDVKQPGDLEPRDGLRRASETALPI